MDLKEVAGEDVPQTSSGFEDRMPRSRLRYLRISIPSIIVLLGIALIIGVGLAGESRWNDYPKIELIASPVDPTELLRGAYVDLWVDDPETNQGTVVRFLAPEDEAREIELAVRSGAVIVEVRRAPDGKMRAVAVVTADGRRFETR